jgi:hypothetical protein
MAADFDKNIGFSPETDLPAVYSPYAAAKLAGGLYCQSFANCRARMPN